MTHQTLYSLRTNSDEYQITKFVDGEMESSYSCNAHECQCPAGARPSCRHRQMLPQMLAASILNTHWFWSFDLGRVVDFNGELKSNIDAMNELAAREEDVGGREEDVDHHDLFAPALAERPQAVTKDAYDPEQLPDGVERDDALAVTEQPQTSTSKASWRRL